MLFALRKRRQSDAVLAACDLLQLDDVAVGITTVGGPDAPDAGGSACDEGGLADQLLFVQVAPISLTWLWFRASRTNQPSWRNQPAESSSGRRR